MKKALKIEFQKLKASRLFWMALIVGIVIGGLQVFNNMTWVNHVLKYSHDDVHPRGLSGISLLIRWIGSDNYTVLGRLFFMLLPLLAAMPYGTSSFREYKSGYAFQLISRCGKKKYTAAKLIVTFVSGAAVIGVPMLLNLMLNAMVCPLGSVHVVSMVGVWQGSFFSELFYTQPAVYMILQLLLGMAWGGVCALMALMYSSFLKNSIMIIIAPEMTMIVLEVLTTRIRRLFDFKSLELSPFSLMQSITFNPNPEWIVGIYLLGFTVIISAVYWKRGMKREGI